MANFKHIYDPACAFGGYEYYTTTNGETAHIHERKPASSNFRIVQRLSKAAWDKFADDYDLHDGNRTNPALISRLASATADDDLYREYIAA
jgi:hypothetical protein